MRTMAFLLLVTAGVVAGLASLFSYPALLPYGLSPVIANFTNTTALLSNIVGSAFGARDELRGQGQRCAMLCFQAAINGSLGTAEDGDAAETTA